MKRTGTDCAAAVTSRPPMDGRSGFSTLRRGVIYGTCLMALGFALGNGPTAAQQTGAILLSTATLPVGASLKLAALNSQGQPASGVTWSSSNIAIASVNSSGVVTTQALGQVTVRAQSHAMTVALPPPWDAGSSTWG